MIENDHQLKITKNHLKKFKASVESYKQLIPKDRNKELDIKAHIDSLESFIKEFEEDIAKYEKLNSQTIQIEFDRNQSIEMIDTMKVHIDELEARGYAKTIFLILIEKFEDALK